MPITVTKTAKGREAERKFSIIALNRPWNLFITKGEGRWIDRVHKVRAPITTYQDFWSTLYRTTPVSKMTTGEDYYFFRQGSMPLWEHHSNRGGGRLIVWLWPSLPNYYFDHCWMKVQLALIGEQFFYDSDKVNGAAACRRTWRNKVCLWVNSNADEQAIARMKRILMRIFYVPEDHVKYESHRQSATRCREADRFLEPLKDEQKN
ncbi:hypothetical protein L596_001855 [Steinernema carpocapsae]|uniref:Uncharacterized protein n=1 Tax=Steinernema carpocapsae TaxID=34508 RepID=A0A4U8UMZ2_STECR|nr:hypothetical protein L596_001855 [Steinernema carpocapsae]